MHLYKIKVKDKPAEWVSSKAEVSHARGQAVASGTKRVDVHVTEYDELALKKESILLWLNKNITE